MTYESASLILLHMKNTNRAAKKLAATVNALTAMLAQAEAERGVWARNGVPTAQKDAEIAGITAQLAKLSR